MDATCNDTQNILLTLETSAIYTSWTYVEFQFFILADWFIIALAIKFQFFHLHSTMSSEDKGSWCEEWWSFSWLSSRSYLKRKEWCLTPFPENKTNNWPVVRKSCICLLTIYHTFSLLDLTVFWATVFRVITQHVAWFMKERCVTT